MRTCLLYSGTVLVPIFIDAFIYHQMRARPSLPLSLTSNSVCVTTLAVNKGRCSNNNPHDPAFESRPSATHSASLAPSHACSRSFCPRAQRSRSSLLASRMIVRDSAGTRRLSAPKPSYPLDESFPHFAEIQLAVRRRTILFPALQSPPFPLLEERMSQGASIGIVKN
jgi:hypothetical protein